MLEEGEPTLVCTWWYVNRHENSTAAYCPHCGIRLWVERFGGWSCRRCGLHVTEDGHRYARRQQRFWLLVLVVIDIAAILVLWIANGDH